MREAKRGGHVRKSLLNFSRFRTADDSGGSDFNELRVRNLLARSKKKVAGPSAENAQVCGEMITPARHCADVPAGRFGLNNEYSCQEISAKQRRRLSTGLGVEAGAEHARSP